MSKDAFNRVGRKGLAAPSGLMFYTLESRLQAPEKAVEIRPRDPRQIITPEMLTTLDNEDSPCIRVWVKDRDSVTFDFPPFPADFPFGYVPSELRRTEWGALFPNGPSFDDIREGDKVWIEYFYDPAPEKDGHFSYGILSIRHAQETDNPKIINLALS